MFWSACGQQSAAFCRKPGVLYIDDELLFLGCACGFDYPLGGAAFVEEAVEAEREHRKYPGDV